MDKVEELFWLGLGEQNHVRIRQGFVPFVPYPETPVRRLKGLNPVDISGNVKRQRPVYITDKAWEGLQLIAEKGQVRSVTQVLEAIGQGFCDIVWAPLPESIALEVGFDP